MGELTTGHELLLYTALIIVTMVMLDWRESRFGPGHDRRRAPESIPAKRNHDQGDHHIGKDA
jgi:hypothetical protein